MIKKIVHYVGFLMLVVFMTGFTVSSVNAENIIKNSQKAETLVPNINQIPVESIVKPAAPATKQQLLMTLFRSVNVCQATMINLGKNFSVSLATIKNIDPTLPVIEQLTTLLNLTKQRYMQLVTMEGGLVQELKKGGVSDQALGEMGASQFNEAINYGTRVMANAHASPDSVEGFIATLLQQNVVCEGGIQASLEQLRAMASPPGS